MEICTDKAEERYKCMIVLPIFMSPPAPKKPPAKPKKPNKPKAKPTPKPQPKPQNQGGFFSTGSTKPQPKPQPKAGGGFFSTGSSPSPSGSTGSKPPSSTPPPAKPKQGDGFFGSGSSGKGPVIPERPKLHKYDPSLAKKKPGQPKTNPPPTVTPPPAKPPKVVPTAPDKAKPTQKLTVTDNPVIALKRDTSLQSRIAHRQYILLKTGIRLTGKIVLKMKVAPDGTIKRVKVKSNTTGDETFAKDMVDLLKGYVLPGYKAEGPATVEFPIEFRIAN